MGAEDIGRNELLSKLNSAVRGLGGTSSSELFESDDTWVVPSGINTIYVTACGGGGAGGTTGVSSGPYSASGGGAGAYCIKVPIVVPSGQSLTISIGDGGTAGTSTGYAVSADGGDGGETSIFLSNLELLVLGGGKGGPATVGSSGAASARGGRVGGNLSTWTDEPQADTASSLITDIPAFLTSATNDTLLTKYLLTGMYFTGSASYTAATTPPVSGLGFKSPQKTLGNVSPGSGDIFGRGGKAFLFSLTSYVAPTNLELPSGYGSGGGGLAKSGAPAESITGQDGRPGFVLIEY